MATQSPYWRSLEEREGSEQIQALRDKEFFDLEEVAIEVSEGRDGFGRRRFMQLMGASAALASAGACYWERETIAPHTKRPQGLVPGELRHFNTVFEQTGSVQALTVASYEGRPIKIEGNKNHANGKGAVDSFAQASLLSMYDPERSKHPTQGGEKRTRKEALSALMKLGASATASGGEGVRILAEQSTSPTLMRLRAKLKEVMPQAKWVEWESASNDNAREGALLAFGQPLCERFDLKNADVIVCLDDDLLSHHPEKLRLSAEWAARRSPEDGMMNRLYAVESRHSQTGAASDHRLPLRSEQIPAFLKALTAEVGKRIGVAVPATMPDAAFLKEEKVAKWLGALAADLVRSRGRSLVTVGHGQPSAVHALGNALNKVLGNFSNTIHLRADRDVERLHHVEALAELSDEMAQGAVNTLLIIGGNPVWDAPVDIKFKSGLGKVASSLHLSLDNNETSRAVTWHINRSHFLESWGDAQSPDGVVSIAQPLIKPLYDGVSAIEFLNTFAGLEKVDDRQSVRTTFASLNVAAAAESTEEVAAGEEAKVDPEVAKLGLLGSADKAWRKALHDGVVTTQSAHVDAPEIVINALNIPFNATADKAGAALENGELELTFFADGKVHDGRWANNGWLQETPDFMTKLTWDNAAMMSPATAKRFNVNDEDRIRISVEGGSIEAPVYVLPGQAAGSIAIAMGYGRKEAGAVGGSESQGIESAGVAINALRTSQSMWQQNGVKIEKLAGKYPLANTQNHFLIDERGFKQREDRAPVLARETTVDALAKDPKVVEKMNHHPPLLSLFQERPYNGHKWGMATDLSKCTGCNACVVACQAENNIPVVGKDQVRRGREMSWIRIDRYFVGDPEDAQVVSEPMTCQQCQNAPCEQVCPAAATVHNEEGLNDMVYNRCIGTRYCSNNCPYKVRRFNFHNYNENLKDPANKSLFMMHNPEVSMRFRGVMEKCTFCVQRIKQAKQEALVDGRALKDGDITPACEQSCATGAIVFGDLSDANSRVSKMHASKRAYALLAELNVKPRNHFLARVRNPNPALKA